MYFSKILQVQAKQDSFQMGRLLTHPYRANGIGCWLENIFLIKVDDRNSILCKKIQEQEKLKSRTGHNIEMYQRDPLAKVTRTWDRYSM